MCMHTYMVYYTIHIHLSYYTIPYCDMPPWRRLGVLDDVLDHAHDRGGALRDRRDRTPPDKIVSVIV